jgi:hypothetical protein
MKHVEEQSDLRSVEQMYQKGYNSIVVPYDAESSRELGDDHWGL